MTSDFEKKETSFPERKEQTTVCLTTSLLEKIEEKWYVSRKQLHRGKRAKLNKSKFYELLFEAIDMDDKLISRVISRWEKE